MKRAQGSQHLALRVTGLDAIAARLKQAGVRFTREPVTTPAGCVLRFSPIRTAR